MKQLQNAIPEMLAFLGMFFLEISSALFAVGFLIVVDTFTGLWAASKKKKKITSKRFSAGVIPKLILYPLIIILAKVLEDYLTPDIPFMYASCGFLAVAEFKSFLENWSNIFGYNALTKLRAFLLKRGEENLIEDGGETGQSE